MSRKAIIEFRKVANSQTLDVDKYFFDNIIPIYEDSVHTPQERAKILEKDILWLLNDMVKADKAIDRSNPDCQQRIPFFNYQNLLQSLILSTADKGIYLSEAFVKAYENVDMGAYSFGEFVRNAYKPAWWEVQPQQKHTEAPQQANRGNSGELTGNGKETPPEGTKKRVKDFKKDCILVEDKEQYIKALHKQIDGEKSADVIIAKIKGAISNCRILKPSYQTLINEFPNIKNIVPKSTFYEKMK